MLDIRFRSSNLSGRARVIIGAPDAEGGAQLRFLDRRTGVPARMVLDDDDQVYLDFVKLQRDSVQLRRLGLHTDTNSVVPLK